MNLLSTYHRKRISEGVRNSKKFKKAQQNKIIDGPNNPNWRPKVIYYCPVCNKPIQVTQKKRAELIKKNRTCSRKCGATITSNKLKNIKRPDASIQMQIDNPMFSSTVRTKQANTLKERFCNGELNKLKIKMGLAGRKNIIKYNKKPSTKKQVSKRMQINNPMFKKDVRKKVSKTLRMLYKNGGMTPPISMGSRFKRGYFIDHNNNTHHYDSGWELKRMQFLDQFKTIKWEKADKHFAIPYKFAGIERTYFPDFIIQRRRKVLVIEEIGKWSHPKYKKRKKIFAARKLLLSMEVKYVVLSEQSQLQDRTW